MQTDSSNLVSVGYLRYIQNLEDGPRKNPDYLVRYFLPQKVLSQTRRKDFRRLRKEPFYHYILPRTLYYDKAFCDALTAGARQILLIGAGTDTRAFRFRNLMAKHGAHVIEADQQEPSREKARIVRTLPVSASVSYSSLDIHDVDYDKWAESARLSKSMKTQVLIEGVSPYIRQDAFIGLLSFLGRYLMHGSKITYCYKFSGIDDSFGSDEAGSTTFRLGRENTEIIEQHRALNLSVKQIVDPHEIIEKYITYKPGVSVFEEDGILECDTDWP